MIAPVGNKGLSSSSSPRSVQNNYHYYPLSSMIGEWVSLNFWLGQLEISFLDFEVDQSVECPAFYDSMLHVVV